LVEKSFDLEPRQLQSAIETGSFEITEMFDQSMIKKPLVVVRFPTLGLSATSSRWNQNADQRATKISD
jgi:hypothetical protein